MASGSQSCELNLTVPNVVLAPLFIRIWQAARQGKGEEARALQQQANRFIFTMIDHNLMPALKQTLKYAGVDAGKCRRPFSPMNEQAAQALQDAYKALHAELGDCGLDFLQQP